MSANSQSVPFELGPPGQSRPMLEGYPSFAQFIAQDKDAAIYRKYAHLSARNLLYLQSELYELEGELQQLDREDAKDVSNEDAQKAARMWKHYSDPGNGRARQHVELQNKIKTKVKEYQEAILLESQILNLNAPSDRTLKAFKKWFTLTSIPVLWGRDLHLFDDEQDLVALAPVDTDRLNVFLQTHFGWFFRRKEDKDSESGGDLFYYSPRRIQTAGAVISIISSAVLLVGAIVCLLLTVDRSIHMRVGIIVLFTCLFALIVGLLTNARRAEIFGSTAAYAAVLVVFVSNDIGTRTGS